MMIGGKFFGVFFVFFLWFASASAVKPPVGDGVGDAVSDAFTAQFSGAIRPEETQFFPSVMVLDEANERMDVAAHLGETWHIVNLWATWCPPCVKEIPSLLALEEEKGSARLRVVFVSLDQAGNYQEMAAMASRRGIELPPRSYLSAGADIWQSLALKGLPTSYLVSPAGEITYILQGDAAWTSPESMAFFKAILE